MTWQRSWPQKLAVGIIKTRFAENVPLAQSQNTSSNLAVFRIWNTAIVLDFTGTILDLNGAIPDLNGSISHLKFVKKKGGPDHF